MENKTINQIRIEIDSIKEYVYSDLCLKCQEMMHRLKECEKLLGQNNERLGSSETSENHRS